MPDYTFPASLRRRLDALALAAAERELCACPRLSLAAGDELALALRLASMPAWARRPTVERWLRAELAARHPATAAQLPQSVRDLFDFAEPEQSADAAPTPARSSHHRAPDAIRRAARGRGRGR